MRRATCLTLAFVWLLFNSASAFAAQSAPNPAETAVLEYIEANMPWPQGTARIEFLSESSDVASSKKKESIRIEPIGNGDFIGDVAFLVRYMDGNRLSRTETVRTRIEVLRDHVIAARALSAGAILGDGDLRIVRKWVRRIPSEVLVAKEEARGKQLATQVRAGIEISGYMIKEAPMVRKGKIVKVIFDNGSMRIVTSGMSEEDGMAGAIIRIRNFTSNKIIYARVIGDSLVGVEI